MPKVVDRTERKRAIAEALLRLVAREGIEAVSVRAVATEAALSHGAVQKYFATKEEIFEFALEMTGESVLTRWENLSDEGGYIELIYRMVLETLPLTPTSRAEVVITYTFATRAALRGDWAKYVTSIDKEIIDGAAELLELAQQAGQIRQDINTTELADMVLAISDGFALRLLYLPDDSAIREPLLKSLYTALHQILAPR